MSREPWRLTARGRRVRDEVRAGLALLEVAALGAGFVALAHLLDALPR